MSYFSFETHITRPSYNTNATILVHSYPRTSDPLIISTVNSRYNYTRYKHNHVTRTLFRCTNFPPPNRLRYRHRHTTLQTHKKFIRAYNELWRDKLLGGVIVSNGGFSPAQSTISLKHIVAPLSRRGNLHRNWAFKLVVHRSSHSSVKYLGLNGLGPHLYLE